MASKKINQVMIVMELALALTMLSLFCLAQESTSEGNSRVLHIHVSDGSDNETCLLPESEVPCQSLGYVAGIVANANSISRIEIIIHSHLELRNEIRFSRKFEVKLTSDLHQRRINCSSKTAGLIFQSIRNLTIEYLTFSLCGITRDYRYVERRVQRFRAAIHIISPTDVMVTNVTLSSSSGAGLAITGVQGGVVSISNSIFKHNVVPEQDLFQYAGGGGIFIRNSRYLDRFNEFIFENCLFLNNRQSTTGNYTFITAFGATLPGTGRGGGLEIVLSDRSAFNKVMVSNCTFIENAAFLGGALAIISQGRSRTNDIHIENSLFSQNGCQKGRRSGSGGAALFGYSFYNNQVSNNQIFINHVTFRENCAEVGGGTTFFSSRSKDANFNNTISFTKCKWIKNKARVGAAIDISPHTNDRLSRGLLPTPLFKDCEFVDNTIVLGTHDGNHALGTGTFFSSLFDITFQSSVNFTNNSGSALIIVNGAANFSSCNATFISNTGVHGGAMSLIGISLMYVGTDSRYIFIWNKASDRGGAIYSSLIDEHDFTTSRSCFIQHSPFAPVSEWNVNFTFKGNSAQRYGHSIFSTSLLPCKLSVVRNGQASFLSSFEHVLHFPNNATLKNQIATDGSRFELTQNLPFQLIPGEEHLLDLKLVDDLNQSVKTTIAASILNGSEGQLDVDDSFSCVSGNAIRLLGDEEESGNLLLQTVTSRKSSILVNVVLAPCPAGFILSKNECICDAHSYIGFTRCNNSHFHAHLKQGFWTGYVIHDKLGQFTLVTAVCPLGFCNYNTSQLTEDVHLPQTASPSALDNFMCGSQRTGVLCGECRAGYTVYYNSPNYDCREENFCKFGWLFYFLSELVPVTILFIVVLTFNFSFTSGAINGFILFSQVLDTLFIDGSGIIKVPRSISYISLGYRTIYGLFSLNLFNIEPLSFCLWKGATVLDILAIKYVTIAYSFILIFSVIIVMRRCGPRMLGKYIKFSVIKTSVINGISTFIVVCYVQCIKVSLNILFPQTLKERGGAPLYPRRVWLNGELSQFSKEHLPYAIPAILVLMTVGVFPPLLLIAYPLMNRLLAFCGIGESYLVRSLSSKMPISKLKPLFDSFQGCFKDNLRFFAGLYFLYRWIGLLVYASTSSLSGFYTITGAVLILILLIHAVAHPYENSWHNAVDALLLADLAIINGITAFEYYYSSRAVDEVETLNIITINALIQLVLIYFPILLYITAFVLIMCYNKCYLPGVQKARERNENESHATASRGWSTSDNVSLGEFPARLLGENTEYEAYCDIPSDHSNS